MKKIIITTIFILTFLINTDISYAGTIQTGYNLTKICKDAACTTYGNLNWKPTLNGNTTGATAVTITDTSISGYVWGDEIGWINLQPTGAGVSINSATGALTGYAYSNVGSWINFSPTSVSGGTSVGVSINSQGEFTGWAYVSGINGGWVEFNCASAATCVKTDWLPTSSSNSVPASSSSGSSSSGGRSTIVNTVTPTIPDLQAIWKYKDIQVTPPDRLGASVDGASSNGGVSNNGSSLGNSGNASNTQVVADKNLKSESSFFDKVTKSSAAKVAGGTVLLFVLIFLLRIVIRL